MKESNQSNWANWASMLHGEDTNLESDIESNPDQKVVEDIFNVRKKVGQVRQLKSEEEVWNVLKSKLAPKKRWTELLKYAAVIFISLLVGSSAVWTYSKLNLLQSEYASVTAPIGQITNVTLFDGTNIWLNAGSTLKYKQSFNQNDRQVFLEGEALFDVCKNENSPFIVNVGDSKIKVHGTVFNVKAYRNEPKIETVLVEGKVQFISSRKSMMLKPGDHLLFSKATGRFVKSEVNTAEYTAWKGGKIYFNNETLANLTMQIERWSEVKFLFKEEHIKSYRFTGVINKEKSLDYTLNIIKQINKVEFEFKNEQITIKDAK